MIGSALSGLLLCQKAIARLHFFLTTAIRVLQVFVGLIEWKTNFEPIYLVSVREGETVWICVW